jgi:hypothetical protein
MNGNNQDEPIYDPGKGKRSPAAWGRWLLNRWGFQRQMLSALQEKPMYHGTANRNKVAKRRAKNKVARRSRAINRQRAKH